MRESEVEKHLVWTAASMGGESFKFKSPNHRGVSDRVVMLPSGDTWFIELKKPKGGKLSALQVWFRDTCFKLNQKYACLFTKEQINQWREENDQKL